MGSPWKHRLATPYLPSTPQIARSLERPEPRRAHDGHNTPTATSPSSAAAAAASGAPLVYRPLRHAALAAHAVDDALERRLDDDAADNHLGERRVQRLEVEDEVELAHVLEEPVERLDEHLDQVEQRQRRLGRRADENEVQRCVVPVRDERRRVAVLLLLAIISL